MAGRGLPTNNIPAVMAAAAGYIYYVQWAGVIPATLHFDIWSLSHKSYVACNMALFISWKLFDQFIHLLIAGRSSVVYINLGIKYKMQCFTNNLSAV